jgi:ubiquinone/menaquinone biosynthesis C-methylase UbiE
MAKLQDPEGIEIKTVLKHLSFDGKDVLEIGCGDGRLTLRYAQMARRVVAIDPLEEGIEKAKRDQPKNLLRKVEFRVGRGEKLVFPDQSFEMVFFSWSLCCTDIPKMGKALDEASRVLRPGGTLINLQPSLHQPFSSGAVSYLIQKKFGTTVDDERYRQSRLALKYLALIEERLNLAEEEEFTVNTYYDTIDEAVDDSIRVRKEQYDKLDEGTKVRIRKILSSRMIQKKILVQENAVLTVLHKVK